MKTTGKIITHANIFTSVKMLQKLIKFYMSFYDPQYGIHRDYHLQLQCYIKRLLINNATYKRLCVIAD